MCGDLIQGQRADFGYFMPISLVNTQVFKYCSHGFKDGSIESFRQAILLGRIGVGWALFDEMLSTVFFKIAIDEFGATI